MALPSLFAASSFYLPCFNPPAIREASKKKKKKLNSFRGKAAWLFYDDYDYFRLSDYPLAGKTKKTQKNKKKKKKRKKWRENLWKLRFWCNKSIKHSVLASQAHFHLIPLAARMLLHGGDQNQVLFLHRACLRKKDIFAACCGISQALVFSAAYRECEAQTPHSTGSG